MSLLGSALALDMVGLTILAVRGSHLDWTSRQQQDVGKVACRQKICLHFPMFTSPLPILVFPLVNSRRLANRACSKQSKAQLARYLH